MIAITYDIFTEATALTEMYSRTVLDNATSPALDHGVYDYLHELARMVGDKVHLATSYYVLLAELSE